MIDEPFLSVGDVARRTGVTVRALHHYDELGLLVPSMRTGAGHRRYDARDVERLLRICALRQLGLSLDDVAVALDGGEDLVAVVRRQLAAVDQRLEAERRLRGLLESVIATLERDERPSVDQMLQTIEVTTLIEKHYTQDQLATLAARAEAYGPEQMREFEREWEEILGAARDAMAAGLDPADPSLLPHARRAAELVVAFHGGDEGIKASMQRMWETEDPAAVSRGAVDRELLEYVGRMQAAARDR